MKQSRSETTRYLTASTIYKGSFFRNKILDYVRQKHKAFAPELGYDFLTVIKLCEYFEDRELKYHFIFFISAIVLILAFLFTPFALSIFLIIWAIRFYKGVSEHKILIDNFKKDNFDSEKVLKKFQIKVDSKYKYIGNSDIQNLVIYNGFSPFVGSGINIGGWSFAVDISNPREEFGEYLKVISFTSDELYNSIESSIKSLGLEGLKVKKNLFVSGSDIRHEKWILPTIYSDPLSHIDNGAIKNYSNYNDPRVRHYMWVQVYDWGDELVLSYFLRYAKRGKKLFVEVSKHLLTPLSDTYKKVDKLVNLDFSGYISKGIKYLFLTPITITYSVYIVINKISSLFSELFDVEGKRLKKIIKNNPLFNYGSNNSLREDFSSKKFDHYFQLLDKEMYSKIIDKEILDTFVTFLDDHNIDTSDLIERQTTILNQGIIVKGGDVNAESMAVGTGAKAKKVLNDTLTSIRK